MPGTVDRDASEVTGSALDSLRQDAHGLGMDPGVEQLDLRGVKCPLNWAKAKVRLETLAPGYRLELVLDDPKGARDIPRAAEAEGFDVLENACTNGVWRLILAR